MEMYLFQSILLDLLYCHFNESQPKMNKNDRKGSTRKYVFDEPAGSSPVLETMREVMKFLKSDIVSS